MATKKQEKQEMKEEKKEKVDTKNELKTYLTINMPGMFDRTPDITGNLDIFVDEIIKIVI
jgi:hypothetical protein